MKKHMLLSLMVLGVGLVSCSEKEVDKIADAQACLDKATPAEADGCVSKVAGIESSGADLIRCVGKFVKEGFNDPAKIITAMDALENESDDGNGSMAMMTALKFSAETTASANSESADEAFSYCTSANSKGLIFLSGLAKTSTFFSTIGPITTPADLENLMNTNINNPAAQEAVGSAINTMYQTNCANGGSTSGEFCQQFESVVGSTNGSNAAVGELLMQCYTQEPPPAQCQGF